MILRYLVFIIVVIIFIIVGFVFVKDLGENRLRVEKRTKKLEQEDKNAKQALWQKGPKHKR